MNEYLNRNDENDAVSTEDFPWLTFSLCGSHYAVNSRIVTSILLLEQQINPIPESPEYIKGIINLRGEIVPLLDLRVLFKMKSFDDEFEEFTQMLAARKQDHINWVAALRKSVENKTEFTLTTDPEKCALGRWLASYETEYASVKFCLKELVEPHEKIHALADEIEHILSNPNGQEEAELLLQNAETVLVPAVISVLDRAVAALKDSHRSMVIILSNEKGSTIGMMVDNVENVDKLEFMCDKDGFCNLGGGKFVNGIAKNGYSENLITMLNEDVILEITSNIKF